MIERDQQDTRIEYYRAVIDEDQLVGFGRLGLTGVQAATLGYAVAAGHRGNGYAFAATRTLGQLQLQFAQLAPHLSGNRY